MEGRKVRATGAALLTLALSGLAAGPALAAPGVSVSTVSSLKGGATAGTLTGTVLNRTSRATTATVTVRIMRYGTKAPAVGSTAVRVGANGAAAYRVAVKLPSRLSRGNYYLSACTPSGTGAGELGCATSDADVLIKGGTAIRGPKVQLPALRSGAKAAAEDCTSGAHTLAAPGERVYPEAGNGGYKSIHTDIYTVYDAIANLLLPGTHVDLQQRSSQCLSDFSLDFDAHNGLTIGGAPGTDMTVSSVAVNGQPATFKLVQPTYPGDPKGQDDPDPLAHRSGLNIPISATNPNPPACAPSVSGTAGLDQPCPATKLVVTPSAPIPSGTDFTVTVSYTGRPGIRAQGDGRSEGWFRNATPGGEGAMVTSEPLGTMAWMPLNDHTRVKPTYDVYDTVTKGKVAIGNGRLISNGDNAPDANFPGGSTSWHWKSSEPVAAYLVENSIGSFDWNERVGANGVVYFEAQDSAIAPARKALNKVAMDQQEDITHFQEQFNGPFPFNADGIVVALPNASFEEEMQTKIVFVGGTIGGNQGTNVGTFAHENMHQWWGDNVSYSDHRYTFFKEGQATTAEYFNTGLIAAKAAGGQGTPAGDAAFEASIANSFNAQYRTTSSTYWTVAPSNPTSANLFGNSNTYTRPGISYVALRAILGKDNYTKVLQDAQKNYGGGSITEAQWEAEFHKFMPNQSADCSARLDEFFKQWWDTAYPPGGGVNKPSITGPGLNGTSFYNSAGGCTNGVGGTVPATLSLSLGAPASFGAFAPGVASTYTAGMTATVISTAGDATLSVADPSTTAPGHLVNGAFALPSALKASATSPAGTGAPGGAVSGTPLNLLTYTAPVSNDGVAVTFSQDVGATDALRTGSYAKTLTFTLSTTTP
ncbi:M1 family aminopeptidase [Candidatus Solirubrobacter pratensis]|uniref:M1 family aminopeptidase n=1 Tax=Candidatus Solirubrobacter pratensis TaxID=1298857 RepID=UPI00047F207F|nr:M1 family aminopeptidase [Candidatus Solirubrobacter pratensis]